MSLTDREPGRGGNQVGQPRLDAAGRIPSWDPDDIFFARKDKTGENMRVLVGPRQLSAEPEEKLAQEDDQIVGVNELLTIGSRNTTTSRVGPPEPGNTPESVSFSVGKPSSWDPDDIYLSLFPPRP
jgi:hypothetical protein